MQRRFHDLISAKLRDAEMQAAELSAFSAQLRMAADHLSGEPVDGPCGPDCACLTGGTDLAPVDTSTVTMGRKPDPVPVEVPIACTLKAGAMSDRVAEWTTVLTEVTRRVAVDGGLRIEFGPDVDLGHLGRLIGAEQRCCAFFQFSLTVDADRHRHGGAGPRAGR